MITFFQTLLAKKKNKIPQTPLCPNGTWRRCFNKGAFAPITFFQKHLYKAFLNKCFYPPFFKGGQGDLNDNPVKYGVIINFFTKKLISFSLVFAVLFSAFGPSIQFLTGESESWGVEVRADSFDDADRIRAIQSAIEATQKQHPKNATEEQKNAYQDQIEELQTLYEGVIGSEDDELSQESLKKAEKILEESGIPERNLEEGQKKKNDAAESVIDFGEMASFLLSVFTPLVAIEVSLVGGLMDNEMLLGRAGAKEEEYSKIGDLVHKMWQIMRDLVNYAFIVVLIIIAFMTVISAGSLGGENNFEVSSALPKLVIGIVLVNFTWFGAKVILDVATVATNIVYAIPQSVGIDDIQVDDRSDCTPMHKETTKSDTPPCPVMVNGISFDDAWNKNYKEIKEGSESKDYKTDPETINPTTGKKLDEEKGEFLLNMEWAVISFSDFKWDAFDENSVASLFAFSIMHVEQLPRAQSDTTEIRDLMVGVIVGLLVMIMIIIVFTAMLMAMIERVIIIWVNIILAPIGVLFWVLEGTFSGIQRPDSEHLGLGHFTAMAFLPATMGIPLMFGFVMIMVAKSKKIPLSEDPESILNNIKGIEGLFPHVQDIHQLFWFILALVIMWTSMKIAQDTAKITGEAIGKLKEKAEAVGSFIVSTPLYATWIPVHTTDGEKKDMAIGDVSKMITNLGSGREQEVIDRVRGVMGDGGYDYDKLSQDAKGILRDKHNELKDIAKALKEGDKTPYQTFVNRHEHLKNSDPKHVVDYLYRKVLGINDENQINTKTSSVRHFHSSSAGGTGGAGGAGEKMQINFSNDSSDNGDSGTIIFNNETFHVKPSGRIDNEKRLKGDLNSLPIAEVVPMLERMHRQGININTFDGMTTVDLYKVNVDNETGDVTNGGRVGS